MSEQLEETAILGLRTQILDNFRHINHGTNEPVLATAYQSEGWIAIIFDKTGFPMYSSRGGDDTAVDALRNLLKYLSEKIGDYFVVEYLENVGSHDDKTEAGVDYEQMN